MPRSYQHPPQLCMHRYLRRYVRQHLARSAKAPRCLIAARLIASPESLSIYHFAFFFLFIYDLIFFMLISAMTFPSSSYRVPGTALVRHTPHDDRVFMLSCSNAVFFRRRRKQFSYSAEPFHSSVSIRVNARCLHREIYRQSRRHVVTCRGSPDAPRHSDVSLFIGATTGRRSL